MSVNSTKEPGGPPIANPCSKLKYQAAVGL